MTFLFSSKHNGKRDDPKKKKKMELIGAGIGRIKASQGERSIRTWFTRIPNISLSLFDSKQPPSPIENHLGAYTLSPPAIYCANIPLLLLFRLSCHVENGHSLSCKIESKDSREKKEPKVLVFEGVILTENEEKFLLVQMRHTTKGLLAFEGYIHVSLSESITFRSDLISNRGRKPIFKAPKLTTSQTDFYPLPLVELPVVSTSSPPPLHDVFETFDFTPELSLIDKFVPHPLRVKRRRLTNIFWESTPSAVCWWPERSSVAIFALQSTFSLDNEKKKETNLRGNVSDTRDIVGTEYKVSVSEGKILSPSIEENKKLRLAIQFSFGVRPYQGQRVFDINFDVSVWHQNALIHESQVSVTVKCYANELEMLFQDLFDNGHECISL